MGVQARIRTNGIAIFIIIGIGMFILTLYFETVSLHAMGTPRGRFAFVFDPVEEGRLAGTLRSSGVFTAVFEIGEHDARDVCKHLASNVVSNDVCMSTPWALVTNGTFGVALFFINGSAGVTSELVEMIQWHDLFSNGVINVYNGTEHVRHVQGYVLERNPLLLPVWSPVGVGTVVDNLVQSRKADMYEASGVPYRFITNTFDALRLVCTIFIITCSVLFLSKRLLLSLLGR